MTGLCTGSCTAGMVMVVVVEVEYDGSSLSMSMGMTGVVGAVDAGCSGSGDMTGESLKGSADDSLVELVYSACAGESRKREGACVCRWRRPLTKSFREVKRAQGSTVHNPIPRVLWPDFPGNRTN